MPDTSYTAAIARSLSDKLGEMPSVKDFASLQAAIDNAVADGSYTLFVPWGTYTYSTPLTIPSGFSLVALGQGDRWRSAKQHCKFVYTGSGAAITIAPSTGTGASNIALIGIEIDCSGATAGTDGLLLDASAAGVTYIENVLVERCTFKGCRHAIHAHGTVFDVTLRRVSAAGCTDDLVYVDGSSAGAGSPSQWRIDDCWLIVDQAGQWAYRCVNNSLAGLTFLGGTIAVGDYVECGGISARGHLNIFGTNLEGLSRYNDPSVDAGTDTFTASAHGWANGQKVQVTAAVSLPGGISANTDYYVVNKTDNTYQLSTSNGGAAASITSAGDGVRVSTLPGSVGVSYTGSLGGAFFGKCINWGVGIQIGRASEKPENATNFEVHPVLTNNGWDVQVIDGGSRSQTKIMATGSGATYLDNLRVDTDGEYSDLVRHDGNVDLGSLSLDTLGYIRALQARLDTDVNNYLLDIRTPWTGVDTGVVAGIGGKVLIGKSSADPDDECGKMYLLSIGGRYLVFDTKQPDDNSYGAKIANSFGPLIIDPKTVLSIPKAKALGVGTLEGDQEIHVYADTNPRMVFEEPIDAVGSAFAGIGGTRDGGSGRKGKLVFYTNDGDATTDNSVVAGYIDSAGWLHLGDDSTRITFGSSDPNALYGGPTGSLYLRSNGSLYIKTAVDATSWRIVGGTAIEVDTLLAYDSDGASYVRAKAGSGQSTTALLEAQSSGGTKVFGVDLNGDVTCRKIDATGAITAQNHGTGNIILLKASGGTELFAVDNSGYAYILSGLTIGSIGANKAVVTNGDSMTVGLTGAAVTAQAVLTGISTTASTAIPAAIDTTGMSGDALTIANKVNDIISALGAGATVIKSMSATSKALTVDRGIVTVLT